MKESKPPLFALLVAFALAYCALDAHAAVSSGVSGLGDERVNQALAEEFAKCSAFCGLAADCAKKDPRKQPDKEHAVAKQADLAKRFYKGGYMLAGQDFTQRRIRFYDTNMRHNAGNACEAFPKLEQQYRKHCDNIFRRLPRTLQ
ncbi:MAG: hypothetical protein FWG59_01190 [Betaproteobacteria bacterium]|nr:hypothetical protein [Betaproteobacteria bacterium]